MKKNKMLDTTDYKREKVYKYLVDIGMTPKRAKTEAKKMSNDDLDYLYNNVPYFVENGY